MNKTLFGYRFTASDLVFPTLRRFTVVEGRFSVHCIDFKLVESQLSVLIIDFDVLLMTARA